ncbi:MAG: hypothetical protein NTU94_16200, partial [Planctomycetota bacterium]|nr:hypothetical protein [Planctomycetota bacterium]
MAAPAAAADAPPAIADVVKQWQAEVQKLRTEVRPNLERQLKEIRDRHANSDQVARLRFAYDEAQAACDNSAKDREIAAAKKAEEQAAAALKQAEAAALASDPTLAQLRAQLAEAKKAADAAEVQRQAAEKAFIQARSKAANSEEVNQLYREVSKAGRALKEVAAKDAKVNAAQKAYDEAVSAYEKAVAAMPEYKTRAAKPDAYEKARHALPQYKARNEASAAYETLYQAFLKTDAAKVAAAARDNAEKASKKKLDDLLTSSPEIVAAAAKRKAAEAAVKTALAKVEEIQRKCTAATGAAATRNPEVVKAKQAYDAARKAGRDLYETKVTAAKNARDAALAAFETKLKERFDADPKVAEINKQ